MAGKNLSHQGLYALGSDPQLHRGSGPGLFPPYQGGMRQCPKLPYSTKHPLPPMLTARCASQAQSHHLSGCNGEQVGEPSSSVGGRGGVEAGGASGIGLCWQHPIVGIKSPQETCTVIAPGSRGSS